MLDTTVAQPDTTAPTDVATETTDTGTTTDTTNSDPFAVDESQFVSLSPEQRAALDPVLNKWKESAKSYAQKEREAEGKKYSDQVKESAALRKLVASPRFVKLYQETNGFSPEATSAVAKTVGSAEEWSKAYEALGQGDPAPLEQLQAKLVMSVGGPEIQRQRQEMNYIKAESEMNKLWAAHNDAKELDQIGREEDPNAPSLLQLCLTVVRDQQGGTMEQAYALAKKVALSMENKGKRAAMGIVDAKKGSVTEKPSANTRDEGVQYVDTLDEAMNKNIEAAMDGRKIVYRVKK